MIYWSFDVSSAILFSSIVVYPSLLNFGLKSWGVTERTRVIVGVLLAIAVAILVWPTIDFISDINCRHYEGAPCDELD